MREAEETALKQLPSQPLKKGTKEHRQPTEAGKGKRLRS